MCSSPSWCELFFAIHDSFVQVAPCHSPCAHTSQRRILERASWPTMKTIGKLMKSVDALSSLRAPLAVEAAPDLLWERQGLVCFCSGSLRHEPLSVFISPAMTLCWWSMKTRSKYYVRQMDRHCRSSARPRWVAGMRRASLPSTPTTQRASLLNTCIPLAS
jgi:hypothetical protein